MTQLKIKNILPSGERAAHHTIANQTAKDHALAQLLCRRTATGKSKSRSTERPAYSGAHFFKNENSPFFS